MQTKVGGNTCSRKNFYGKHLFLKHDVHMWLGACWSLSGGMHAAVRDSFVCACFLVCMSYFSLFFFCVVANCDKRSNVFVHLQRLVTHCLSVCLRLPRLCQRGHRLAPLLDCDEAIKYEFMHLDGWNCEKKWWDSWYNFHIIWREPRTWCAYGHSSRPRAVSPFFSACKRMWVLWGT